MTDKVKFKDKIKVFGKKFKASAKKNPKLFAAVTAVAIIASGGSASGLIEAAAVLNQVGDVVEVIQSVTE